MEELVERELLREIELLDRQIRSDDIVINMTKNSYAENLRNSFSLDDIESILKEQMEPQMTPKEKKNGIWKRVKSALGM